MQFKDYHGFFGVTKPPQNIKFSKAEQMRIYNRALKTLKIKQGEPLFITLITDSLCHIFKQKFYLDFYLEILKACYTKKEVKSLLMMFNLNNVILPRQLDKKEYLYILNSIEKNPNLIIKHCSEKDNEEKYFKLFYTLLLFFGYNYENDKVQNLINNKDLWKYFTEILTHNSKFFPNLNISDELINNILNQKGISYEIVKDALSFGRSVENVLSIINNNCNLISNLCLKENKRINMVEIVNFNKTDDLNKIIKEIEKLIYYQLNSKKIFILFRENFWENYIKFNEQKNYKNLVLIKKAIILCQKIDKDLNLENFNLNQKIHITGLQMIEKGILKNEELINFIENEDVYFKEKAFESIKNRPLLILKGIDLETVNDKFFEMWNSSSTFKIFSFCDYQFKKELINKVDNMKYFGKLLRLFNYDDENILDINTVSLLKEKFINIINTYKKETCPNFIKDVSFFVYVMDKKTGNISRQMFLYIEKQIHSLEMIIDIYNYIASNYKDISEEAIDTIINYFINKKYKLKNASFILSVLKKINSEKSLLYIFNEINSSFLIEEQDLFSEEKDINSLKILEEIEKQRLIERHQFLKNTKYIISTVFLKERILNKIKIGEIRYGTLFLMWNEKEKKDILKQRLNIILFNNNKDIINSIKNLDVRFKNTTKVIAFLKKLKEVLKEFYENMQDNIKIINNFEKQINEGMLNLIEKEDIINQIEKLKKIINDLDIKYKLKTSIFFTYFFKNKKAKNIIKNEEEIFVEAEENFKQLKLLFEENWVYKIDEPIIIDCYNALKNKSDINIQKELNFLKDYFDLNYIDSLYIKKLTDEIMIFKKRDEITQFLNSCIHFILKFNSKPTDFHKLLLKLNNDLTKNISVDKIKDCGKKLEKYGINILNPKEEDKNYLNILNILYLEKDSFNIMMNLNDKGFLTLEKILSESKNITLNKLDIQEMINGTNFFNGFNLKKNKITDEELLKLFIEKVRQNKNISTYLTKFINNSEEINKLLKLI